MVGKKNFITVFTVSRSAENAVNGLLFLASKSSDGAVTIREISKAEGIPISVLAKIFQTLAKKRIVRSIRGRRGGFVLSRSSDEVNLLEVIEAVEGRIDPFKDPCPRVRTCPVHDVLKEGFKKFISVLHKNSLLQLLERRKRLRDEEMKMGIRIEVKEQGKT